MHQGTGTIMFVEHWDTHKLTNTDILALSIGMDNKAFTLAGWHVTWIALGH